jgi:hypothetical protein
MRLKKSRTYICLIINRYIAIGSLTHTTVSENLTIRINNRHAQHKDGYVADNTTKQRQHLNSYPPANTSTETVSDDNVIQPTCVFYVTTQNKLISYDKKSQLPVVSQRILFNMMSIVPYPQSSTAFLTCHLPLYSRGTPRLATRVLLLPAIPSSRP